MPKSHPDFYHECNKHPVPPHDPGVDFGGAGGEEVVRDLSGTGE